MAFHLVQWLLDYIVVLVEPRGGGGGGGGGVTEREREREMISEYYQVYSCRIHIM